jgi:hypothetical protein
MKLKAAIWDSSKTKVLGVIDFNDTQELQTFMKELRIVDARATYRIVEVAK